MDNILKIAMLILIASLPPLTYLIWIGTTKKRILLRWYYIAIAFIVGMTFSMFLSLIIELMIVHRIGRPYEIREITLYSLLLTLVVAPFVEEFSKGLGFLIVTKEINKVEHGLVYGVAIGLGFSLTENLLYEWKALATTFEVFIFTVLARSIASVLIHASATAITGYGVGKFLTKRNSFFIIVPFYLIAVGVHSLFNFFASSGEIYGGYFKPIGLIFVFVLSIVLFEIIRYKIGKVK